MLHGATAAAAEISTRRIDASLNRPQYFDEICFLVPPLAASGGDAHTFPYQRASDENSAPVQIRNAQPVVG
jgi:hypothetical protein